MSSLRKIISDIFADAISQCAYDPSTVQITESQRKDLGQFQCNTAFALAKSTQKKPMLIAQQICDAIKPRHYFKELTIAGAGFINICLTDEMLAQYGNTLYDDPFCGFNKPSNPLTVVIDYSAVNVAKPMHVGHLRSTIIGDSIKRLLQFCGHTTIGDNHLGDWGTQMGMLICEIQRLHPHLPYFDKSYSGPYPAESPVTFKELETLYPQAAQRCKENEEEKNRASEATNQLQKGRPGFRALWQHIVDQSLIELKQEYNRLGIQFDLWLGESFYTEHMIELITYVQEQNLAVLSDGALTIPVAQPDDTHEIPPVMLVKSDGGFLYATSDLACIDYRMKSFKPQVILYVVGAPQQMHFEQIFRAARKINVVSPSTELKHISFGTINGSDGKPFKTRAGGVMKLGDVLAIVYNKAVERMKEAGIAVQYPAEEQNEIAHKIGIATVKFADLSNHRMSNYTFDIDKFSKFEGKTGPYILYSAVRIKSILRKAQQQGLEPGILIKPQIPCERELFLSLGSFPDIIENAVTHFAPNFICDSAHNIAQQFNTFYATCHILNEQNKQQQSSWLRLSQLCLKELELYLSILGIEIPERM